MRGVCAPRKPAEKSSFARTSVTIRLLPKTVPTAIPDAFSNAEAAEMVSLESSDVTVASFNASIVRSPAIDSGVSRIVANERIAAASPRPVPNNASNVLNNRFCDSYPSVLNASITPTAVSPELTALRLTAEIDAEFVDVTLKSPPAVVVTRLSAISASAPPSTELVTTAPLTARLVPVP